MSGSASYTGSGCYELTPNTAQKTGAVWFPTKVSLNESFIVSGRFNFGTNSISGADGIAFALQPVSTNTTGSGAGMGLSGITPSLIVEFDTWKNSGEPLYDHLVIEKNGDFNHTTANKLAGPVNIVSGVPNVKNGTWYPVRFIWDVATKTFTVEVNCQVRLTYTGDIVNTIFGGNPDVYWGFSSATGNNFNQHRVCLDATDLIQLPTRTICQGDTIGIELPVVGKNYSLASWVPTTGIVNAAQPRPIFQPTTSTTYEVSYRDYCDKIIKDTFDITVKPSTPLGLPDTVQICNGTATNLTATSGLKSYSWSTGASTNQISVNSAGKYVLTAVNVDNCKSKDSTQVINKNGLTVNLGSDASICAGQSKNLDAGNTGSTYLWNTGEITQSINVSAAGQYHVLVTHPSGCTGRDTINVTLKNKVNVNLGADTSICDGIIKTLNAAIAGGTYLWNTGETTPSINVVDAGQYFVEVNAANYCAGKDTILISKLAGLVVNVGKDTTVCSGATISLNASITGGTYLWNTGATTQNIVVNSPGSYSVTVNKTGLCKNKDTISISQAPPLNVNLGNDATLCSGSNLTLDAGINGSTYLWNTGEVSKTINISNAGTYSVEVTSNGCKDKDTIQISNGNALFVNLGNDTSICSGSTLTLDAENTGSTYTWSTGENTQKINITSAGKYVVNVSAGGACIGKDSIVVTINPNVLVDLGTDTGFCVGNSLILDAGVAGANYLWSTGSASKTINVSSPGIYFVEVNLNGCIGRDTVNVSSLSNISISLGSDTSICSGAILTLDCGVTGASYLWSTGATTKTIQVSSSGKYSVTASSGGNCSGKDTIQVNVFPAITLNLGTNQTICPGDSVNLNAQNPGATYSWNTGATSQSIFAATSGNYFVTITDGNLCSKSDTVAIQVAATPTVNLGSDFALCAGNNQNLSAGNPGSTYLWNTGSTAQRINVTNPGLYWVKVTNASLCSSIDTINIANGGTLNLSLGADSTICEGTNFTLIPQTNGTSYLWSNGSTLSSQTIANQGLYWLEVQNPSGCTKRDSINVYFDNATFSLVSNHIACEGETFALTPNSSGNWQFIWDNAIIGKTLTTNVAGYHYLMGMSMLGCIKYDTTFVEYIPYPSYSFSTDTIACEGKNLQLTVTTDASNILWGNGTTYPYIAVSETGNYSVTLTNSKNGRSCTVNAQQKMSFIEIPEIEEAEKYILCFEELQTQHIVCPTNAKYYAWEYGKTSTTSYYPIKGEGVYHVKVFNDTLCPVEQEITVEERCPLRFYIPNAFTPDNDGKNEFFKPIIANSIKYEFYIFNRWGEQLYYGTDANDGWNGQVNGHDAPIDVYIWKVEASGFDDHNKSASISKMGSVTLIR